MKLGMILDAPFPDDARVSNECDELIKSGHEIFLFCLSYKKKFQKIEVYNGINIRRYFCSKIVYKSSALANDLPFYTIKMKKKIRHFVVNNNLNYLHLGPYYDNPNFDTKDVLHTYNYKGKPFLSHLKGGFSESKMTSSDFSDEFIKYLEELQNAK